MSMRTSYGSLWKHDSQEALSVWLTALAPYSQDQIKVALGKCLDSHVDYPPTLPQFLQIIGECVPLLPGSAQLEKAVVANILAYATPQTARNPKGNPHGITLSTDPRQRRPAESLANFGDRIANEVTAAMYLKRPI